MTSRQTDYRNYTAELEAKRVEQKEKAKERRRRRREKRKKKEN